MIAVIDRRLGMPGPAVAALVVCACAVAPYLTTVNDYFVRDDFGVVQLLAQKPATYFPRWFVSPWTDNIWRYTPDEIRPFPALSYQITSLGGANAPFAHHVLNIALHAVNGLLVLAIARVVAGLSLQSAMFGAVVYVWLPVHAESVAWITGRVDSFPALFYLGSFLAYAIWRRSAPAPRWYLVSLACFFIALFSKQTAITMVATLIAYDLLVERRVTRPSWTWARPYVPFMAMTVGYLVLRYALFGEVAREGQLSRSGLTYFVWLIGRHLTHVVTGHQAASTGAGVVVVAMVLGFQAVEGRNQLSGDYRYLGLLTFFGPVWWLIGVAPILVAGYESPRHVYLAAAGWAVVVAGLVDALRRASDRRKWRFVVAAVGVVVLGSYGFRLLAVVRSWSTIAAVSQQVVRDVSEESSRVAPRSLLIIDAPVRSWEFAIPFSVRPPFTARDITERVAIISPGLLHCCREHWFWDTREALQRWLNEHNEAPIVVLYWDESSGRLTRITDRQAPQVRQVLPKLLGLRTAAELDIAIRQTVAQVTGQNRQ